jgi:hypothetical protein
MTPSRLAARPASAGFAYLWVLLLVALMGLGLGIAIDVHATAVRRDKERELLAIGQQFRTAIARYFETRTASADPAVKGEYPATLAELLKDNRSPSVRRHLRRVFVDPMTGKPEWGLVRVGGRIVGVHSLSEQTPIKQDHFEAEEADFRGKAKYSDWVFVYPADLLTRPPVAASPAAAASSPALAASAVKP